MIESTQIEGFSTFNAMVVATLTPDRNDNQDGIQKRKPTMCKGVLTRTAGVCEKIPYAMSTNPYDAETNITSMKKNKNRKKQ